MLKTIKAIYKNGIIEPLEETYIESGTEINITIDNSSLSKEEKEKRESRLAQIHAIKGKYAFVRTSSEDFAQRKQKEIELER